MDADKAKKMLWVEKYRPQTIEECIIPSGIKDFFLKMRDRREVQNMLLSGPHGTGKTTIARALCNELNADVLFMNCSKDNSINDVRGKIDSFSMSTSLTGELKVFIGDEFDEFSQQGQKSLRGVIEQTSSNCRYIMTCNYPNRIIEPLESRLTHINFTVKNSMKPDLAMQFMKRCESILNAEEIEYDKSALALLIQKKFPDFRKVIADLQSMSMTGPIDLGVVDSDDSIYDPYIMALKKKDFEAASNWLAQATMDPGDFYRMMDTRLSSVIKPASLPNAIEILHKNQVEYFMSVDPLLCWRHLTSNLLLNVAFK